MSCKPWDDSLSPDDDLWAAVPEEWQQVLAHRVHSGIERATLGEIVGRFAEVGITAEQVRQVLVDGGDNLYRAACSGEPDWADRFGGPLGVALLAAEVSALSSHLISRAAGIRSVAVDALLEDYSAITVAAELGVSRQKVYEIARNGLRGPHLPHVPWRQT